MGLVRHLNPTGTQADASLTCTWNGGLPMINLAYRMTKQAIADRKGVTALEYALVASAIAAVVIAAFGGFGAKIKGVLEAVLPA